MELEGKMATDPDKKEDASQSQAVLDGCFGTLYHKPLFKV